MYEEAAASFETYLKVNYCVEKILEGKTYSFQSASNTSAYEVKKYLSRSSNYTKLLEPFNTVIWNSIKHKKLTRDPKNKKIDSSVGDSELTKNLYASLMMLSKFHYALLLKIIEIQLSSDLAEKK